jgi:undecaprenyl-diphosphatase
MPGFLVELFARYGYAVIFVGVLLENAGVPAPGHTVVLAGAFLAQGGRLSIGWVFAVACVAAICGDNAGYWLGRKGGRAIVERHRKLLHLSEARQKWIEGFFERHGAKTVFLARFVTGLQTVGALFAGMSGMRWPRFFLWNALGAVSWSAAYSAAGYLFGTSWDALHRWIGHAGLFALATIVAVGAIVILHRRRAAIVAWLGARLPPGLTPRAVVVIALAISVAGVFAKLAEDVVHLESAEFDRRVSLLLHRLDSPAMDATMRILTGLGSWPATTAATAVTFAWCLVRRDRRAAVALAGVVVGAELLNVLFKDAFERARPSLFHLVPLPPSYAFPSGHAMRSAAAYGMIAFIISRELPRSRWVLFAAASALVLSIGVSRVFLGVHWATDVLAGFAAGAFAVLVGVAIVELAASRREGAGMSR